MGLTPTRRSHRAFTFERLHVPRPVPLSEEPAAERPKDLHVGRVARDRTENGREDEKKLRGRRKDRHTEESVPLRGEHATEKDARVRRERLPRTKLAVLSERLELTANLPSVPPHLLHVPEVVEKIGGGQDSDGTENDLKELHDSPPFLSERHKLIEKTSFVKYKIPLSGDLYLRFNLFKFSVLLFKHRQHFIRLIRGDMFKRCVKLFLRE